MAQPACPDRHPPTHKTWRRLPTPSKSCKPLPMPTDLYRHRPNTRLRPWHMPTPPDACNPLLTPPPTPYDPFRCLLTCQTPPTPIDPTCRWRYGAPKVVIVALKQMFIGPVVLPKFCQIWIRLKGSKIGVLVFVCRWRYGALRVVIVSW